MCKKLLIVGLLLLLVLSTVASAAPKVTTIKYIRWAGTQEAVDFQTLVNKFMKANPDVKVETEFLPWTAYWDKIKTMIMSGSAPDVISFSHQMSAAYVSKAALYDMSKLAGAKGLLNEMQPGTKMAVLFKNKVYGMPVGVGVRALIYNKDMFKEAGIAFPSNTKPMTYEEFMKIGKKLTKVNAEGKVTQYAALFDPNSFWENLINQNGGKLLDNNTRPTKLLTNTPQAVAGLQQMVTMVKEQVCPPFSDSWNGPWGSPDSAVVTRKVAMMCAGPWALGPLKDNEINFGTAPLFMTKNRATRGYINFLAMGKNTKNPQASWKFIKWMCSATGQLEFTKTGDLPSNAKALESVKKQGSQYPAEIMEAYFSELPYVTTGPMIPSDEFTTVTQEVIDNMMMQRITPQDAAKQLQTKGNAVIKKVFAD